jgi:hypothetical protein
MLFAVGFDQRIKIVLGICRLSCHNVEHEDHRKESDFYSGKCAIESSSSL